MYSDSFSAVIRTCKALHWSPVDYSTHARMQITIGKWRLPNRKYSGVNPDSSGNYALDGYYAMWKPRYATNYKYPTMVTTNRILYALECNVNVWHGMFRDTYGGITFMISGKLSCGGNIAKCPYESSK